MSKLQTLKDLTRPARRWAASTIYPHAAALHPVKQPFDHKRAQKYELEHNATYIKQHYAHDAEAVAGDWLHKDEWFKGKNALWLSYREYVRDRRCLEIGAGPIGGELANCKWIKHRAIIEPLAERYRALHIELCGSSVLTDDIKVYPINAEQLMSELVGNIDGAIICRNALDHCEDPLAILSNISEYAASGCWLLFWSDIWHFGYSLDDGHRNITKSKAAMDRVMDGCGFDIVSYTRDTRDPNEYVEFGCVARKR